MGLKTYADQVLANLAAVAAANNVVLPALQYVAPGPWASVSYDCDQAVVTVDLINRGAPGQPNFGFVQAGELTATISVGIIRVCMPTSNNASPPLAADQAAAAAITLGDLDLLRNNVATILDAAGCRHSGLSFAGLIEIQGGAGGAMMTTAVDLLTI